MKDDVITSAAMIRNKVISQSLSCNGNVLNKPYCSQTFLWTFSHSRKSSRQINMQCSSLNIPN